MTPEVGQVWRFHDQSGWKILRVLGPELEVVTLTSWEPVGRQPHSLHLSSWEKCFEKGLLTLDLPDRARVLEGL